MTVEFVHVHTHSEYSLLDGMSKISDLLRICYEHRMPALALTEHGNMFSAVPFYKAVQEFNEHHDFKIKPIIGCEVYVAPKSRHDKMAQEFQRSYHHLLLLCENGVGYKNLCKLVSIAYLEGHHKKPRIDMDLLREHHEGLIVSSACLSSRISRAILADNLELAELTVRELLDVFGKDRFYIEIMDHGLRDEEKVNPVLIDLAKRYELPLIATQDSHYTYAEDADAHEVLLCVQTQTTLMNENRMQFGSNQFHFRSPEEMARVFRDYPEALRNTLRLAERCEKDVLSIKRRLPKFKTEGGIDSAEYLRRLVEEGFAKKFGKNIPSGYRERAEYELSVIEQLNFVDYFLVVWDLVHFAKTHGIPVGPGRGSAAGSLVSYLLDITTVDPIRYQLLFERFLNPDRKSMPDIDIDFSDLQREEVIQYAIARYGEESVSLIATFHRLLARNVVRDVGRVLGMSYDEVDRIAKMIPAGKVTLKEAVEMEPDLRTLIESEPNVQRLWNYALKLEGTIRNSGTHAAGIVICDEPIVNFVALFKDPKSNFPSTQAEKDCVEYLGLLKMDILGLRTLTVIQNTIDWIKKTRGKEIDIESIPLDDPKTFELLQKGETLGVFQLESAGMRDVAVRMKVNLFEEISALVALYRPGPMKFIDTYIENKFHPDRIQYWHPSLEPILKETYGIPIYQEQVMQIAQVCAGFSLPQADTLRSGISKKKQDLIAKMRTPFVEGCKKNGISEKLAEQIYENIQEFGNYGFNKSHSVAYAKVSYQTAYLKANYPVEYMCALLTSELDNLTKVSLYIQEAKRMGIKVLPPDINHSDVVFTIEQGAIRFGLGVIKNVGEGVCEEIIRERNENGEFTNLIDFCSRLSSRRINKRVVENLIKSGAFDSFGMSRKYLCSVIDDALAEGQRAKKERSMGQISLFGEMVNEKAENVYTQDGKEKEEWPLLEKLSYEKEVLGLYLSGHPLEPYAEWLSHWVAPKYYLERSREGEEVILGGVIIKVKTHTTDRGRMAFVTLEDVENQFEVTFFSDTYEKNREVIKEGAVIFVLCRVSFRNAQRGYIAQALINQRDLYHYARAFHLRVDASLSRTEYEQILELLLDYAGDCDVFFHYQDLTIFREIIIQAHPDYKVSVTPELVQSMEDKIGKGKAWYSPGYGLPLLTLNGRSVRKY